MIPAYPRAECQARICDAVAAGATLRQVGARPGWPCYPTIWRWARDDPAFAARLKEARLWRRGLIVQAQPGFDPAMAQTFLLAVRRGGGVRKLVRSPDYPNRERVRRWRREQPDFAAELRAAVRFARQERPARWARYDEAVADRIILRLNQGEPVPILWSDPDLPGGRAFRRWRRLRPDFDHAVRTAIRAGQLRRMARRRMLTPERFDEILEWLMAGDSLAQVAQRPGMPHAVTLSVWAQRDPAFAEMVRWAKHEARIAEATERVARVDAGLEGFKARRGRG